MKHPFETMMGNVGKVERLGRHIKNASKKVKEAGNDAAAIEAAKENLLDKVGGEFDLDGHTVVVHANSENVTHIVVPYEDFLTASADYIIPEGYEPSFDFNNFSGDTVDQIKEKKIRAYNFRLGDYTFALCG